MNATFRALPVWPHPVTSSRRSRHAFKAGWADTLWMLTQEVGKLNGTNIILAAGFREADIRADGMPRANARVPSHPGVEISFDTPVNNPVTRRGAKLVEQHGGLTEALKKTHPDTSGYDSVSDFQAVMATQSEGRTVLATDAYDDWQSNARAIALTMKALRDVDRWGATQGKQYAGFQQITSGKG